MDEGAALPPIQAHRPGLEGAVQMTGPEARLRVLYYNHTAEVSGAEVSLLRTADWMPDDVAIEIAGPEGEFLARARERGIAVHPIRSYRARMPQSALPFVAGLLGTLLAGLRLRHLIWKTRPHVLHANSIRAGLIAIPAVLGTGVRLVWHVRDNLPRNALGRVIRWLAAGRANRVIAVSRAIRDDFAGGSKSLKKKTTVVYDGISLDFHGASLRAEVGASEDAFVMGVVGQIAPWKRQMDAIESFTRFVVDHPKSELWIVGAPKFREENAAYDRQLRSKVSDLGLAHCVRFLGFRNDVMNVMASLDVLLTPSDNEPFGLVLIEAMMAGKPVVGTQSGGIPEIVVDGETGLLHPVGDVAAIVRHLLRLQSPELRAELGARAKARVMSEFTMQATSSYIYRIYEEVTRGLLQNEGGEHADFAQVPTARR